MRNILLKKLEETNAVAINVIIFCVGVIFILTAIFIGASKISGTILISIGTSIVASSIVVYLSSKYLFKQNRIKALIENWGLYGIYRTRAEMNESTNENLKENINSLDIIAFGLRSFRDSQGELIKSKVSNGMRVRILTIDPKSEFLIQRELVEGAIQGQIKNTIIQLIEWIDMLKQNQISKEQVQIKYYDSLPLDFYFRLDNALYVGPYLYGITSQQTISYEYRKNSHGYDYFSNYFERLWNNESFAKEIQK